MASRFPYPMWPGQRQQVLIWKLGPLMLYRVRCHLVKTGPYRAYELWWGKWKRLWKSDRIFWED